jgi:hypothetical protein
MKKLIILITAITFSSCRYTTGYYIDQDITTIILTGEPCLKTRIWHRGELLKAWFDVITINTPDTIKCYRIKQAKQFILKCEKIDNECN